MQYGLIASVLIGFAAAQQWQSSMSVEELGRQYLENEASRLNFGGDDELIDPGRQSAPERVTEEEGRSNVDTVEFNLENNKDLPSQSRLTEHSYETNKRIINNRNTRLERYNINNYITNDHTNYRTRIHNPHTITEVVNHNYRQIKPYITTYIRRNVDTVQDEQVNPTDEQSERTEEYDVEKLPVEHNVVDQGAATGRLGGSNIIRNTNRIGRGSVVNRRTSPTARFGGSYGRYDSYDRPSLSVVSRPYNNSPASVLRASGSGRISSGVSVRGSASVSSGYDSYSPSRSFAGGASVGTAYGRGGSSYGRDWI